MLKRIINITIWTIIGLYTAIVILLHIPFIQTFVGERVADALCHKFGTKVSIGRVDLGFVNRLIIDDTEMQDQQGKQMLRVSRISVKIDLLALANGEIEITSAQFFGLQANLYKATADSKPNFQFVVDSLASKDTTKQKTPLNLQINSLIIRNGSVSWRVLSRAYNSGKFSPDNINAHNISAHIIINRITDDSLNVKVKRIALEERCGLKLKALSLHAIYGPKGASINDFNLELPSTLIQSENISASFQKKEGKIEMPSLKFNGSINAPRISLADIAGFVPKLSATKEPISLKVNFNGSGDQIAVTRLELANKKHSLQLIANGGIKNYMEKMSWFANVSELSANHEAIASIVATATGKDVPAVVTRIGDISLSGHAYGDKNRLTANAKLATSLGDIKLALNKSSKNIKADIETKGFDVGKLADNKTLGHVSANLNIHGTSMDNLAAAGRVYNFDFNGYKYHDIQLNASYRNKIVEGKIGIDDPNADIDVNGLLNIASKTPLLKVEASVNNFAPHALGLTPKWQSTAFAANINCDIKGNNINNANGMVEVSNFKMQSPENEYALNNVTVKTGFEGEPLMRRYQTHNG